MKRWGTGCFNCGRVDWAALYGGEDCLQCKEDTLLPLEVFNLDRCGDCGADLDAGEDHSWNCPEAIKSRETEATCEARGHVLECEDLQWPAVFIYCARRCSVRFH